MASNDLSTTNTALDVSSVMAVSSEPVLAGTNLAGADLAGLGADLAGPDSGQVQVPIWQVPIWQVPIWQVPPGPSIVKPKKGAKGHIPYLFLFFSITAAINCSSLLATVCTLIAACTVLPFLFGRIVSRPALVDSALMLAGDDEVNDWDARKYPKCRPFMGKKGVQFENFVRDFGAAISSEQDDDNDLEETMLGDDIGGDNYAGPAPSAAATRRRDKRLKSLYSHLYRHVADLRFREMMHASARNDGRAAYLLLATHCRREITDLEMFDLNSEWDSATFVNTVGISLDTITTFSRYMNGLNARRHHSRHQYAADA